MRSRRTEARPVTIDAWQVSEAPPQQPARQPDKGLYEFLVHAKLASPGIVRSLVAFHVTTLEPLMYKPRNELHLLGEACGMPPTQVAYFVARCEAMQKTFAALSAPL